MRRARVLCGVIVATIVPIVGWSADSQEASASAKVYREQFSGFQEKVQSLLDREKAMTSQTHRDRVALLEELVATMTLIHRLGEEAGTADLQSRRNGAVPDKALLLVNQGCEGLSFVVNALQNFVDTRDRMFLVIAADGMAMVKSVRKFLQVADRRKCPRGGEAFG